MTDPLDRFPLFAAMERGPARERLAAALRPERHAAGTVLVREHAEAREVVLLVTGEVEVRREERLLTILEGPELVGLVGVLDDEGTRSATVRALADVEVLRLPAAAVDEALDASPALRRATIRFLAGTVRGLYDRDFDLLLSFDDIFESPNAALLPGPYEFQPYPATFLVLECDPAKLQALLPPGLTTIPGMRDRMMVVCSFVERCTSRAPGSSGRWFSYQETTPFIPCLADGGRPGLYTPELYPDAYLPIILGREVYGFPKRFGRTVRRADGVDLWLGDRPVMRARWSGTRATDAQGFGGHLAASMAPGGELPDAVRGLAGLMFRAMNGSLGGLMPDPVVFVRRQLLSERSRSERILRIDELVEVPCRMDRMSEFALLDAPTVSFPDPSYFLAGRCVGAASARMGFDLGAGRVRRDYLAESNGGRAPAAGPLDWLLGRR